MVLDTHRKDLEDTFIKFTQRIDIGIILLNQHVK